MTKAPIRWHFNEAEGCWEAKAGEEVLFVVSDDFVRRCGEKRGLEETRTAARDGRVDFVAETELGAVWIKRIIGPRCLKCGASVGPMVARWMGAE